MPYLLPLLFWYGKLPHTYGHFTTTVKREYRIDPLTGDLVRDHIKYVFICKRDPDNCKVHCKRRNTGRDGTQNLRKAIRRCDARHHVPDSLAAQTMALIPYSNVMFRVLLVVWCVVSYRPFHTVADQLFFNIVHMLWPDAVVPTPHTLSSDLLYIFGLATTRIRDTFLTGAHLAIDGWSSPLTASFLGVVVFWRSGSTMWRSVLDFIHLTHSHTGAYLAEKTLECLDRFGLRHHIVSVCLHNASNNDVLVRHLGVSLPNFPGANFRGRCMAI
ncbi:hypothetical protein RSOL_314470 [Rhizoctonia solani AG-3 Rhs1AP]|uniref:Uncharacterized protein n=1 Tax=Rhizoctonia solani AG-3 Rhs1AP TaxID=1086054 RepID=A0A0A1UKU0_9AGAM|nr:hypothetical protein RSOL_314470 [Rhizoctonia solani AG-3 Rhs1AP]